MSSPRKFTIKVGQQCIKITINRDHQAKSNHILITIPDGIKLSQAIEALKSLPSHIKKRREENG